MLIFTSQWVIHFLLLHLCGTVPQRVRYAQILPGLSVSSKIHTAKLLLPSHMHPWAETAKHLCNTHATPMQCSIQEQDQLCLHVASSCRGILASILHIYLHLLNAPVLGMDHYRCFIETWFLEGWVWNYFLGFLSHSKVVGRWRGAGWDKSRHLVVLIKKEMRNHSSGKNINPCSPELLSNSFLQWSAA